jgi:uncharacterized protein (UPF0276 family)
MAILAFFGKTMNMNPLIGIGLRHPHYQQVLEERPPVGWFEVHSENFFYAGGPALDMLSTIREHYPVSLHGVGLSLGSASGILQEHLTRLGQLVVNVEPFLISEHLSWSQVGGVHMPDLLPIPYTNESLDVFCRNLSIAQDFLGREMLIENPSSYIEFKTSHLEEVDFLVKLCQRTGAKILLDVNNVFVSCSNHGWDTKSYIDAIPANLVQEIHLAGHSIKTLTQGQILRVDTHDDYVCPAVWDLYGYAVKKFGAKPTLLEWDAQIPELAQLINEAAKAQAYLPAARPYENA